MKFPLADWIDSHDQVRHNLAKSGMVGSVEHPYPSERAVRSADPASLRAMLADLHRVAPDRVFLTHGATEANSAAMFFLASRTSAGKRSCRIALPEYPTLFDTARATGWRLRESPGRVGIAVVSQPRNPEGDLWSRDRLRAWTEGAEHLLVDETFREFAGTPSLAADPERSVWVSGTFTKFFAGDDFRVGFLVVPEREASAFARFHGLLFDELSRYSVAAAVACLRRRERIRREVERLLEPHRAMWQACFPNVATPAAPLVFDRPNPPDGDALAARCLERSILVCPGRFFGDVRGVRLTLTRRSFPRDLEAYLAVREESERLTPVRPSFRRKSPRARPRRGGTGRARGARS